MRLMTVIGTIGWLALLWAPIGLAQATPPPGSVVIESITYTGTGCPAGSAVANVAPDNRAFTVLFDHFLVSGTGGQGAEVGAGCAVDIAVRLPAGWAYTVASVDTRGYAALQTKQVSVELTSRVFLDGHGRAAHGKLRLRGPFDDNFQVRATLPGGGQSIWSGCGGTRHLRVETELKIKREALAAVDSLDGELQTAVLGWKRCP